MAEPLISAGLRESEREDGLGFLRTPVLQIIVRNQESLQVAAQVRRAALGFGLILLFAGAGLRAQVVTTPSPATSTNPQAGQGTPQTQGARVPGYNGTQPLKAEQPPATVNAATDRLQAWVGLRIEAVEFEGVDRSRLEPLPELLETQPNRTLKTEEVRDSLRRLYATGLYKGIAVEGIRRGNAVRLVFRGQPQFFLGRVTVRGVKDDRLASQLERAARLTAGTRYDETKMTRASRLLTQTLQENGYYLGKFDTSLAPDNRDALMNVHYDVKLGKQTRVGGVALSGDPGMTVAKFRKKGKLKAHSKVTRDTVSRALSNVGKYYEKKQRLEATVALESKQFQPAPNLLNLNFQAEQGPLVTIVVEGVKLSKGKVKNLVPVYTEGTVDQDLLNEGDRRLRDYYQREGYFDAEATHTRSTKGTGAAAHTQIVFDVNLGERRKVRSVAVTGNHYFSDAIIFSRLTVHKAGLFMPHGRYSQALAQADVNTITALYESNGFSSVTVTPVVRTFRGSGAKTTELAVKYEIIEGVQDLIGKYDVTGNEKVALSTLKPLLSTEPGQPYSATNIMADRDSILTYYYSQGFDHATVSLTQYPQPHHAHLTDVTMKITEGEQTFVNRVLTSGLHFTRPSTVAPHILVKTGEPLNQSALLETQRQLYDLTLFNEVNTSVENPRGDEERKDVLVQFTEAKRWNVSYGVGFQAQTGNPSTSCPNPVSLIQLGINPANYQANCGTNGKTGASALVLFDASRINLGGRNQSITLRSEYGSLEQSATAIYSLPHIFSRRTFDFSLSGGYTNAQDVTTYAASRLEGTVRFTERPNRPNTLLYQFTYRRVKVDPNSVQVAPNEIPLVSEPVRVGGPGMTWIRDTRRPTPLDAVAGTYTSVQEFVTDNVFASQANFNRLDLTNSSYYEIGKRRYVIARDTRFGFERAFGQGKYEYIPLPERLYAGGAQSLRGFPLNSAGPRDSLTGFPIGGAGVFVNSTELRFPNPNLPYFGTALGFVLFHDMGNVFNNSSDIWPSAIRIKQPHSWTCGELSLAAQQAVTRSSSTNTTGTCDFNDFSHALGTGLRYHTPIGPLRLDFSYNLNPPIYPVIITYGTHSNGTAITPYVGQAGHFNFFFSIGQAF